MAATTRTITGPAYGTDGALLASKTIVFDLLTPFTVASDGVVLNNSKSVTTDENGDFSITLAVPDSDAWTYQCTMPYGDSFLFNLESGASIALHEIINDRNLSSTVSASTLSSYLQLSQILDEDDMSSDDATYPATQQSVKAYVDSQVVSAGVDTDGSPVADDFAQFVDGNTLKGLSATEFRSAINVEDGADVTDTANVTAAGAVMDSEVTDLAGIKALDTSTIQSILAEGAFVDGDKTKLDGIETAADVTDAANVAAAGAIMEDASIISKSAGYQLASGDEAKIIECDGTFTITLPNGLDTGFQAVIVNIGSGTITLAAATTLTSKDSAVTLPNQYGAATVYHAGSNVWRAFGDLE